MASLPDIPKGKELEDFVAGLLRCGGYAVETSIEDPGILEFDVVATSYDGGVPRRHLFEVKSGGWRFGEIFKVLGWKAYLGDHIDSAYFVATPDKGGRPLDYFTAKCSELGVTLIAPGTHLELAEAFVDTGLLTQTTPDVDHALWRYSVWVERLLLDSAVKFKNSNPVLKGPAITVEYLRLVNSGVFFVWNTRHRVSELYRAFGEHPRLARGVAAELDGSEFDPIAPPNGGRHWREALWDSKHPIIQAALYAEHRARFTILRSAVDYVLLQRSGELPGPRRLKIGSVMVALDEPPTNFGAAVRLLDDLPHPERIPVLWQCFLWKWGGFLLSDQIDSERRAIGEEVGLDPAEVEEGLKVYDALFPLDGGWWSEYQGARLLKLFPGPIRGIGAVLRRVRVEADDFSPFLNSPARWLHDNLVGWNNSTVRLLESG